MKLNLRSRLLRLRLCGFAILVLLIGLLAFRPSMRPELAWRLLAVTQTNGEWKVDLDLVNSGQIRVLAFNFGITPGDKDGGTNISLKIGPTPGPTPIGPGEHLRITAFVPNSATGWSPDAETVPFTSEVKLALWMEKKGWVDRFPDFFNEAWRNRFKKQTIMVSGGPFTNSASVTTQK